ncbi:hypothetical protein ACFLXL_02395 [Chloroflexota bacterium]
MEAVCGHYDLDRSALMLPRAEAAKSTAVSSRADVVDIMLAFEADDATKSRAKKAKAEAKPKTKKAKGKAATVAVTS